MGYAFSADMVLITSMFLMVLWIVPCVTAAKEAGNIVDETAIANRQATEELREPAIERTRKKAIGQLAEPVETKPVPNSVGHRNSSTIEIQLTFRQLEPPSTFGRLTVKHNETILLTEQLDIASKVQRQTLLEKLAQRHPRVSTVEVKKALCQLAGLLKPGSDTCNSKKEAEDGNKNSSAEVGATKLKPDSSGDETKERLVTNMFYDTSIRQALVDIAAQTGVIIVPDMSVQGIVTCELKDVPLEKALEIIVAAGGYMVKKMDGYYLVGSPSPKGPNFQTFSVMSTVTSTIKLNYLKAEDAKNLLPEDFTGYVKANKERNEVCITAPRGIAERILNDLKNADRPPRQVMLEAKMVELTAGVKEQLGVDWEWEWENPTRGENIRSGMAAFDTANNAIQLGYATTAEFTKRLFLTLALLCENNSATIIANPRVTAMDGQKAEIKVTTEEYFKITTGPTSYAYATLQTIESGITLEMTPHIGTEGEITLEVSPEVSDVVGVGAEGLPKITRRRATTTVRVKDGGTVVIGGMVTSTMQDRVSKVPLLGDIPVLGHLFKSTEARENTRDVLIFITPRILAENNSSEPITTAVKGGQKHETVEPASQEFKKQLREVLSRN